MTSTLPPSVQPPSDGSGEPGPAPQSPDLSALLAALVESSDDAIVAKSLDGTVLFWNRGAERIFGYTASEMVGRPITVLAPPERTDEMPGILAAIRRGERLEHFQTERVRKDGRRIYVSLSVSPIHDASGQIVAAAKIARDITEQRRLQEALAASEERFRRVAESIDALFFMSEGYTAEVPGIVYANSGYERIWGRPTEELYADSRAWLHAVHPEDRDRVTAALDSIGTGGFDEEFRIVRPDGEIRWVHDRVFPVRAAGDGVLRAVGLVQDITDRKQAEAELAEKNRALAAANEELSQAEEEMREQNEELLRAQLAVDVERSRYQELFELAPDGYLVTDLAGNVLEANRAATAQLGVPAERMVGTSLLRFVPVERRRSFRSRLSRLAGKGAPQSWEVPLAPASGAGFEAALAVTTMRDSEGRPTGLRWLVRDVTERKEAERERARLLASEQAERARAETTEQRAAFLAEASGILAASLDAEATLESLARLIAPRLADYCQIFELDEASGTVRQIVAAHADPAKEPLLQRFGELYRMDPADPASVVAAVLRTGRAQLLPDVGEREARALLPPGEMLDTALALGICSGIVAPLLSRGQSLGALVLTSSGSGRRYGEADLVLAEELARRAATALDHARLYREAREASAAKDQFIATLSHELRTPLTPVLALVSSLEEEKGLPEHVARAITRIRRNVELEARLIDDLLDLTRVARGKLELKREVADLRQIVEHAVETCCTGRASSQPEVVRELAAADHRLWGDAPRLTQVFWNLLHNACKFTASDGRVVVRSRREEGPQGTELVVEVCDTGIGIDPELLPMIFDAFEQGRRGIQRRFGGLGLGLAVTKAIVELHGGRIEAASEGQGRGSTFTVRLPVGELPAGAERPAEAVAEASGAADRFLHILLVEDHMDTAEVMAELLRSFGHRVTPAHAVADALAAAEACFASQDGAAIDLVVSDLGLPDGTGLDLMRELAGRWDLQGIALSGYGMDEDLARSREAGFALHLTKPVDLQALIAAIREISQ